MFNRRNLIKSSLLVPFVGLVCTSAASGVISCFPEIDTTKGQIDITEGVRYFLSDEMKSVFDSLPKMTIEDMTNSGKFYVTESVAYQHSDIKTGCAYLANKITEMHKQNPLKGNLGIRCFNITTSNNDKYIMVAYTANRI